MQLHNQIKDQMKEAMKAREAVRLGVLRSLLAAFTNELVTMKRKPDEELGDEEALTVIRRAVKQRQDSVEQFRRGNREDLASKEEAELEVLKVYLPQMMSRDEILPIARAKQAELGITDKSKMGLLMGAIVKELKGRADGRDIKEVVEKLLAP